MNKNNKIWAVLTAIVLGIAGIFMIMLKTVKHHKNEIPMDIDPEDEGQFDFQLTFSGGARYINTDEFKKAYLRCMFGGMEVYFDNADLYEGKATINVDVSFGGVELYLPKDWTLVNNAHVMLGAVEATNEPSPNPEKVLNLVGNVSWGAVEITYV